MREAAAGGPAGGAPPAGAAAGRGGGRGRGRGGGGWARALRGWAPAVTLGLFGWVGASDGPPRSWLACACHVPDQPFPGSSILPRKVVAPAWSAERAEPAHDLGQGEKVGDVVADRSQLDQAGVAVADADGLQAVLGVDLGHGGVAAGGVEAHGGPWGPAGAGAGAGQRGLEGSGGGRQQAQGAGGPQVRRAGRRGRGGRAG